MNDKHSPRPAMTAAPPPGSTRSLPCSWEGCGQPAFARAGLISRLERPLNVQTRPVCLAHVSAYASEAYLRRLWEAGSSSAVIVAPLEGYTDRGRS